MVVKMARCIGSVPWDFRGKSEADLVPITTIRPQAGHPFASEPSVLDDLKCRLRVLKPIACSTICRLIAISSSKKHYRLQLYRSIEFPRAHYQARMLDDGEQITK